MANDDERRDSDSHGGSDSVEVDPSLVSGESESSPPGERVPRRSPTPTRSRSSAPASRGSRPRFGLPIWGWVLALGAALAVVLTLLDLRNRDRFLVVCEAGRASVHQGRRLPWPVGHRPVGGPNLLPVPLAAGESCYSRSYGSQVEAEAAFLSLLLRQVRTRLESAAAGKGLDRLRAVAVQGVALSSDHPSLRPEARRLLAEVCYREARQSLTRAEDELRLALARFREARRWGEKRRSELGQWVVYLEALLRAVAPAPRSAAVPTLPEQPGAASDLAPDSDADAGPRDAGPPREAGKPAPPPDAGAPERPGILM